MRHLAVSAALSISLAALSQTSAFADGSSLDIPTNLSTTPTPMTLDGAQQPCGTSVAYAAADNVGGIEQVMLSATLQGDGDTPPLYAEFSVTDETTGTALAPIDSVGQVGVGTTVTVDAPVTDGHSYSWTVRAADDMVKSSPSEPCDFTTDIGRPYNPTVTSTDFPTSGGGQGSGQAGSFTVTSSDPAPATGSASGLKGYSYVFDGTLGVGGTVVPPNDNGSLTISNQSFTWGTHTLSVQAVDNAGNVSSVTQYSFYVAQSPNPELSPKLNLSNAFALSVTADDTGSTSLWPITNCSFDFGDQSAPVSDSTCTAAHQYAKLGTYPVTLTITDQYGNQKSVTETFTTPGLSKGTLFHQILTGTTGVSGWASPAGSTGIAQAADTGMPNGSSQLVAVTNSGALEHNIRNANGSWQGWRTLNQPGVTLSNTSIAGMPNGSSQIIEVTSTGILKHTVRNANGSWQATGWGTPAGSTGIVQAAIAALPDGSTHLVAITTAGNVENTVRYANGSWYPHGWGLFSQTIDLVQAGDASIAGMPNGTAQVIEVSSI